MSRKNQSRRSAELPAATVELAASPAAPAASAAKQRRKLPGTQNVRQLAKAVASIEQKIESILSRLAIVEQGVNMLQYTQKPVPASPIPPPYYPSTEPWKPIWRPDIVWCEGSKQGKLSDYFT